MSSDIIKAQFMTFVTGNQYVLKVRMRAIVEKSDFLKKYIRPILKKIALLMPEPRDFLLKNLPDNPVCCEIGVWKGEFSKRIVEVAKPKKLYLVDPWKYFGTDYYYNRAQPEQKFEQQAQDQRFQMVTNMFTREISDDKISMVRMISDDALPLFEDDMFDFVYIDGNHSYEYVKKDVINYYKKTKPGGIIAGDDYRMEDVQKAVREFVSENKIVNFKVKNDQFVIRKPFSKERG